MGAVRGDGNLVAALFWELACVAAVCHGHVASTRRLERVLCTADMHGRTCGTQDCLW